MVKLFTMETLDLFHKNFTKIIFFLSISCASFASEFTFRVSSQLSNLDWNQGEIPQDVVLQIMEGLTKIDENNKVQPAIAKSWKQEGSKIIFQLRENAKWSDGKQVCAEDFLRAWKKALDPKTISGYAHVLFNIKNAKKITEGQTKTETLGVQVHSCQKLVVTLERPISFFDEVVSHWVSFPMREKNEIPITNGAYKIKQWKKDKEIVLEKNPFYFDKNNGPDQLKAILIQDDTTALRLFEEGMLDWMRDLPFYERMNLKKKKEFKSFSTNISYHLGFNVIAIDADTRVAILSAVDTAQIPKILNGDEIPFDNAKAALELVKKPKMLELHYYTKEIHNPLMEWLAADLEKKLQIKFELKKEDSKIYWEKLKTKPYDIFLSGVTPFTIHPYGYYSEFISASLANWGRFQSKKYDEIVKNISLTKTNSSEMEKLIQEAENILLYSNNAAIVPLYKRRTLNLILQKWSGFEMNELGRVDLSKVRQKKGD